MLVKTCGCAVQGIDGLTISIEVDISNGLQYHTVGLADTAVKESMFRVGAAIKAAKCKMPQKRILVHLAPANVRKEGAAYDLPIALAILAASEQISSSSLTNYYFMGELSLSGELKPIQGALCMAVEARKQKANGFILPLDNLDEANLVPELPIYGFKHLLDVIKFLKAADKGQKTTLAASKTVLVLPQQSSLDFAEVKGQESLKRALEIAAAGNHHVLLYGPPGSGKTMLAKRLPSIMPPLSFKEALTCTQIYSVAGKLQNQASSSLLMERPFRSPHHSSTMMALVGGGANPKPGEISLAHNGILFLDELPEFKRYVLEVLRQPLEEKQICLSRAQHSLIYPSNFMLVAAMNPCPCGFATHPDKECVCSPLQIQRYRHKISGPLLDRIDLQIEVQPVSYQDLQEKSAGESSTQILQRVLAAKAFQNNTLEHETIDHQGYELNSDCQKLIKSAMQKLQLSARAYHSILKVARTIADLALCTEIQPAHLAEAIQYRSLDKNVWKR